MGNRYIISIHAPREGGDTFGMSMSLVTTDFNPRPPRGGRPYAVNGYQKELDISIHAPREGGDVRVLDYIGVRYYFNPRPPRGGRLQVDGQMEM